MKIPGFGRIFVHWVIERYPELLIEWMEEQEE